MSVNSGSGSRAKNGIVRCVLVGMAILAEFALMVFVCLFLSEKLRAFAVIVQVAAIVFALAVYSSDKTSAIRMPWVILLLIAPVPGLLLYLLIGTDRHLAKTRKRFDFYHGKYSSMLHRRESSLARLEANDPYVAGVSRYIERFSGCPVYDDSQVDYYPLGEVGLEAQKEALRNAKRFIFMEYYAIEDSESWRGVLSILEEKVAQGVEVRLIYDDLGSIGFIDIDFMNRMNDCGVKCRSFNVFRPGLNFFLNNRDHRKITVVDGTVGFVGGYNIADEYFNIVHPYGHWKDTAVRITGNAVNALTAQFLEMWGLVNPEGEDDDRGYFAESSSRIQKGFVQPFGETPTDGEMMAENVYISIINEASDYVWFVTPYLIITDEMTHALTLAAKRGVDVRIVTPGIPDKRLVWSITRSYYHDLAKFGVRIFEYSPGFCHAKMCVSDDHLAICGTINLDFRSLYHHFESGCLMCDCDAVGDIKDDFVWMFEQSRAVSKDFTASANIFSRLKSQLLRLFSQLM